MTGFGSGATHARRSGPFTRSIRTVERYTTSLWPMKNRDAERSLLQVFRRAVNRLFHDVTQEGRVTFTVLKQRIGQYAVELFQNRGAIRDLRNRRLFLL